MPRRPRTYAPGNETRLRLAQAATDLVLERGTFDGLAGPDIERKAGKGRGLMRHHWPDLSLLKLAIAGHHGGEWTREMALLADQARSCRTLTEAVAVIASGIWAGPAYSQQQDHATMLKAVDEDRFTRLMIEGWAVEVAPTVWTAVEKFGGDPRTARIVAHAWIWTFLGAVRSDTPYEDWLVGALGVASILDAR